MFYQYLRGRQYELLAVRATAELIANSKGIIPVIEPVVASLRSLTTAAATLMSAGAPLILLTNPVAPKGDWEGTEDILVADEFPEDLRANRLLIPGHIVLGSAPLSKLESFLRRHAGRSVAVVHQERCKDPSAALSSCRAHGDVTHLFCERGTATSYRDRFPRKRRVLVRDGFSRQDKNALYPPDDFFSDLHSTYKNDGYDGFGDYSIVGDHFRHGGGNPRAVAIHLTYLRPTESAIYCRHFVSDSNDTTSDPGAKFMEAAHKAAKFLKTRVAIKTAASTVNRPGFVGDSVS